MNGTSFVKSLSSSWGTRECRLRFVEEGEHRMKEKKKWKECVNLKSFRGRPQMSVKNRVKLLAVLCASYTHQRRHVKVDVAECEWLILSLGPLTDSPTDNKEEDKCSFSMHYGWPISDLTFPPSDINKKAVGYLTAVCTYFITKK